MPQSPQLTSLEEPGLTSNLSPKSEQTISDRVKEGISHNLSKRILLLARAKEELLLTIEREFEGELTYEKFAEIWEAPVGSSEADIRDTLMSRFTRIVNNMNGITEETVNIREWQALRTNPEITDQAVYEKKYEKKRLFRARDDMRSLLESGIIPKQVVDPLRTLNSTRNLIEHQEHTLYKKEVLEEVIKVIAIAPKIAQRFEVNYKPWLKKQITHELGIPYLPGVEEEQAIKAEQEAEVVQLHPVSQLATKPVLKRGQGISHTGVNVKAQASGRGISPERLAQKAAEDEARRLSRETPPTQSL